MTGNAAAPSTPPVTPAPRAAGVLADSAPPVDTDVQDLSSSVRRIRITVSWMVSISTAVLGAALTGVSLSAFLAPSVRSFPPLAIAGFLLAIAGIVLFLVGAAQVLAAPRASLDDVARDRTVSPLDPLLFAPATSAEELAILARTSYDGALEAQQQGHYGLARRRMQRVTQYIRRLQAHRDTLTERHVLGRYTTFLWLVPVAFALTASGVIMFVSGYVSLRAKDPAVIVAEPVAGTLGYLGTAPASLGECFPAGTRRIPVVIKSAKTVKTGNVTTVKAEVIPNVEGLPGCPRQTFSVSSEYFNLRQTPTELDLNAAYALP